MTTLKTYLETDNYNGIVYKDYNAFKNNPNSVCYIPENAEDLDDTFTYQDLYAMVAEYLEETETTYGNDVESFTSDMFDCLEWEFPSTYLDNLDL